ncbi:Na/Pi-cotransporter II-related protein [uncultured Roseburia sp.]|uniref:Na/Pi cotransporter family protein n=1 Tax=Brotonthovivens ammoniilytica TaxID=2981725 RepID=A0ABT2TLQ9_9FIRM|nr:Na/Pi cotransporter family protein [Brotonthovivens ammoniilytica]MCU6763149.1 Na/Pi cotransporter family protein [Brotonthovivens ammoniilytica]SCJ04849.1 Na/Pi-cotransporter II-related protein [uncultured Roseburia sp.]
MSITEIFSLLGGVGLFLLGMSIMSTGLRNACGDNLQIILEHATKNKVIAVLVGLGMTMLIQSSSATDVMVIGFVNSAMMNLSQAIGVIMGANIGTTVTAQITAFNLSAITPLLLFAGAVMYLFVKRSIIRHIGSVIMGFGMLFQGISLMKLAIAPLSESEGFIDFLSTLNNPALALVFGVAFTALLQSSSSSTVIFQAFAIQGLLSYDVAVYLVIGAAIGSVTPNLLAALTANRNGKRAAILNLLFNLIRAGILVALINIFPMLLTFIQNLSPGDVGRQIANTHTIFAIIAVLIELPFANKIVKLSQKIIPVKPEETQKSKDRSLQYMTQITKLTPVVALNQAQLEITRMGKLAAENLQLALNEFFNNSTAKMLDIKEREETVDILNRCISDEMAELRSMELTSENIKKVSMMTIAQTDIERLSDHAENIIEYVDKLRSKKACISPEALEELKDMAQNTMKAVHLSLDIFSSENYDLLSEIEEIESVVDRQEKTFIDNHIERLMRSDCTPISGIIFSDLVTDLERCSDHAINIAYSLKERI